LVAITLQRVVDLLIMDTMSLFVLIIAVVYNPAGSGFEWFRLVKLAFVTRESKRAAHTSGDVGDWSGIWKFE
jgi:hypothetical protein